MVVDLPSLMFTHVATLNDLAIPSGDESDDFYVEEGFSCVGNSTEQILICRMVMHVDLMERSRTQARWNGQIRQQRGMCLIKLN